MAAVLASKALPFLLVEMVVANQATVPEAPLVVTTVLQQALAASLRPTHHSATAATQVLEATAALAPTTARALVRYSIQASAIVEAVLLRTVWDRACSNPFASLPEEVPAVVVVETVASAYWRPAVTCCHRVAEDWRLVILELEPRQKATPPMVAERRASASRAASRAPDF